MCSAEGGEGGAGRGRQGKHLLVILVNVALSEDVAVEGDAVLRHGRLPPAPRLVPELGAGRDGGVQPRDLRRLRPIWSVEHLLDPEMHSCRR